MKEAGVSGAVASVWYGVFAPAATQPHIVNIVARAVMDASRSPDFRQRLVDLGAEPFAATPEEFGKLLREEVAKWTEIVKAAGIRAD